MRSKSTALLGSVLLLALGCRSHTVTPEQPMPPGTILLSAMMRDLSARPGFTEALLAELKGARALGPKKGPALLTSELFNDLRKRILGRDWQGLDRFPGWTMREINPTVDTASKYLAKNEKLEGMSAVHPGAPPPTLSNGQAKVFLDLGPYGLDRTEDISLDTPSTLPGFTTAGLITNLGEGVTRGDGPNDLAPEHAESQRLADVLNRLAANGLGDNEKGGGGVFSVRVGSHTATTPEGLVAALAATGHEVTVNDARYFANFGHLHFKAGSDTPAQDVMMPFWVNTGIAVPDGRGWLHRLFFRPRPLLVPVSHAEYEWHVRAPKDGTGAAHLNADVSYYFGVDGKSEWRTMDTLDQAWVLKRNAHTYTGEQALEVTRLTGLLTVALMHQHAKRPGLPFGGYYALGVCQDGVSAIEKKLTGHVTLFPNTVDAALFDDPRDAEVNALMRAIPKDRTGVRPEPGRVFGSLPAEPGDFSTVTIPGLRNDLQVSYAAWQAGSLEHVHGALYYWAWTLGLAAGIGALAALLYRGRPRAHVR